MDQSVIDPNALLSVYVRSTESVLYEGQAKAITCFNTKGRFDVLPYHVNFISLIQDQVIILTPSGETINFTIGEGIIRIAHNQVTIFWGFETI